VGFGLEGQGWSWFPVSYAGAFIGTGEGTPGDTIIGDSHAGGQYGRLDWHHLRQQQHPL